MNREILRKQASKFGIGFLSKKVGTIVLARLVAEAKVKAELPECFGILFDNCKTCEKCIVKIHCNYVKEGAIGDSITLKETSEDDNSKTGFKVGSRPAILIERFKKGPFCREDMVKMSATKFNGAEVNVDHILDVLRQKKLLVNLPKQHFKIRKYD